MSILKLFSKKFFHVFSFYHWWVYWLVGLILLIYGAYNNWVLLPAATWLLGIPLIKFIYLCKKAYLNKDTDALDTVYDVFYYGIAFIILAVCHTIYSDWGTPIGNKLLDVLWGGCQLFSPFAIAWWFHKNNKGYAYLEERVFYRFIKVLHILVVTSSSVIIWIILPIGRLLIIGLGYCYLIPTAIKFASLYIAYGKSRNYLVCEDK